MKKLKRYLPAVFKLTIAAAVLFVVSRQVDFEVLRRLCCSVWILPAMFFYLLHMIGCAWRWQVLARVGQVPITFGEAVSLTMQGFFFSLVIPGGAIGGDVVKMGMIARRSADGKKADGAFSVLVDRIAGMFGLFLLALILLIFRWELLCEVPVSGVSSTVFGSHLLPLAVALVSAGGIGAGIMMFFWRSFEKISLFNKIFRCIDRHSGNLITRLEEAAEAYRKHWGVVTWLVFFSIVLIHLGTVVCFAFLLIASGIEFNALTLATAVTVGNIAGIIPLFPGGIGARDLAVLAILAAAGMPDCAAVQLMFTALAIFFSLVGGLFFIFDPGRKNMAIKLDQRG